MKEYVTVRKITLGKRNEMLLLGGLNVLMRSEPAKYLYNYLRGKFYKALQERKRKILRASYIMQLHPTLNNQLELPLPLFFYSITWLIYLNHYGT